MDKELTTNEIHNLFREIIEHVNDKFCENKLDIGIIRFATEENYDFEPNFFGEYCAKVITIKEDLSLKKKIEVFSHELVHAYQFQILNYLELHNSKKQKLSNKAWQEFLHNKTFYEIFKKFNEEIEKFLQSKA